MTAATATMLDAAVDYARRGCPVFPCHTPTHDGCSCGEAGCHSPGKHPRIAGGFLHALTIELYVRIWWTRWPDANIGIATGQASGFFVLDVDPRHGGDDTLRELEAQHGPLPATVESLTGGGGRHILFRYPGYPVKSAAGVLGPGLDIRGDGGYIVAPPSLHASGRRYEWEAASHPDDVAIAEAPEWLLTMMLKAESNGKNQRFQVGEAIHAGERNDTIFRLARSLKAKGLSPEAILAAVRAENQAKCEPPLSDAEVEKIATHATEQPDRPDFAANGNGEPLAPLRALADSPTAADIEAALRIVVNSLAGVDGLRRATLRGEALSILKAKEVIGPAKLVDAAWALAGGSTDEGGAQPLTLADPEPWPEPVDGAALLKEIEATLTRFVILPRGATLAIALWVLHAYAVAAFAVSPILTVVSATMRCGKTTLLSLLSGLLPRALSTANITPAALFRCIEQFDPTLLIDEGDAFLAMSDELRGVLNAGHTRMAGIVRTVGEEFEPRLFRVFGPKVLAMIGKPPGTIEDRSIVIPMKRKTPGEQAHRFRLSVLPTLEPMCRMAARWAHDHVEELKDADPDVPESLNDRAADNWRPLLAIADRAGGDWPDRARTAALILSGGERDPEADGVGVALIGDCVSIFKDRGVDRLSTTDLIVELVKVEGRPWPEWNKGKPITPRALGRLLKPFGIVSKVLRIGESTPHGYECQTFDDPYLRYFQGSNPQHPQQVNEFKHLDPTFNPQQTPDVADTKSDLTVEKQRDVADVADRNPENGLGDLSEEVCVL